jgi:hypothetical protein
VRFLEYFKNSVPHGSTGLLSIFKSLSALERSPPESRLTLNLQRLQGLSMLVFYPLEYISFFSAPFAPLLRISPAASMKAQLWSVRSWGLYVALKVAELCNEWSGLVEKERAASEDAMKAIKKRKRAILYQLTANISRLPVIMHWCVNDIRPVDAAHIISPGLLLAESTKMRCGLRVCATSAA